MIDCRVNGDDVLLSADVPDGESSSVIEICDQLIELRSHLSAVLSLVDSKSFMFPEQQRVIMAARDAIERKK